MKKLTDERASLHPLQILDAADLLASATCLLPGAGGGPRTLYARTQEGTLIHVSKVKTGTTGLICPDCRLEVRARRHRSNKADHFYHLNTDECRASGETAIHLLGKELLATSKYLMVPHLIADSGEKGNYRSETFVGGKWIDTYDHDLEAETPRLLLSAARLEVYQDGVRPDLIVQDMKGRELYVEILVTHNVEEKKKSTLRQRNNPTIEIDLSDLDRTASIEEIKFAVIEGSPRVWIHNSAIDTRLKFLVEEADRERREESRKEELAQAEALKWANLALKRWREPAASRPQLWTLDDYQKVAAAMQRGSRCKTKVSSITAQMLHNDGARSPFATSAEVVKCELFSLVVMNGARAAKAYYATNEPEYVNVRGQGRQLRLPPRDRWSKSDLLDFVEQRGLLKHGLKDAWGRHLHVCRKIEADFMAAGNFIEGAMNEFIEMGCIGKARPKNASRYSKPTDYVVAASFLRSLLSR